MPWSSSNAHAETMSKYVLHCVLLSFGCAILLFLSGFTVWQFGITWLAAGFYALAIKIIWLAFSLLLVLQAAWILRAFGLGLVRYFHREAATLRRVAALQTRLRDVQQRQLSEKDQLYYQYQIKRHRLLAADSKKHNGELFRSINAELGGHSASVNCKAFRKALKRYRKQADPQAMLALRKQTLCQSSFVG